MPLEPLSDNELRKLRQVDPSHDMTVSCMFCGLRVSDVDPQEAIRRFKEHDCSLCDHDNLEKFDGSSNNCPHCGGCWFQGIWRTMNSIEAEYQAFLESGNEDAEIERTDKEADPITESVSGPKYIQDGYTNPHRSH